MDKPRAAGWRSIGREAVFGGFEVGFRRLNLPCQEQRQRLTESLLIQEVLLTLSRFLDLDQLLGQLLTLLEEFLGYSRCTVLMYDKEHSLLRVVASRGFTQADLDANRIVPINQASVCGRVALTRTPLYVTHSVATPGDTSSEPMPLHASAQSSLAVPMVCGIDVDFVGVLLLESEAPGEFT